MNNIFRKFLSIIIILTLLFTVNTAVYGANGQIKADANTQKIKLDSKSAVVYCENTGKIVYSKNINQKIEPFSTTKLMTAFLAIQNVPLDKEITVPYQATMQGGSSMGLIAGEKVTVKDLLYGAMLRSGNDACYVLALAVSGDVDKFVKLMNRTARNIGCENTHFVNPHGMRDKKHYTTAYDLLLIAKMAFSNEQLVKIAGTKTYKMKKTNKSPARTLENLIDVIQEDDNHIYAAKTGSWDATHCGIAVAYEKKGLKLIGIILGSHIDTRMDEIKKLVNTVAEGIKGVKVVDKGVEEGKVRIKHGAKTRLKAYTAEIGYAFMPKEASKSLINTKVVIDDNIKAPVKKGDAVGKLEIYLGEDIVNKIDLVINENVDEGWIPSYFGISNRATVIIGIILLVILILYITLVAVKKHNKKKRAAMRKRKIMNMARKQLREEQEYKERNWRF